MWMTTNGNYCRKTNWCPRDKRITVTFTLRKLVHRATVRVRSFVPFLFGVCTKHQTPSREAIAHRLLPMLNVFLLQILFFPYDESMFNDRSLVASCHRQFINFARFFGTTMRWWIWIKTTMGKCRERQMVSVCISFTFTFGVRTQLNF